METKCTECPNLMQTKRVEKGRNRNGKIRFRIIYSASCKLATCVNKAEGKE
jgi:hypothetical protein